MREYEGADLASYTTMRVGGPAARLVEVSTTDELVDAVREVDDADEELLVVSGGSNLVISDDGFAGTAVVVRTSGVELESADGCAGAMVRVAAGEEWDGFVARTVAEGWSGVECLSGIPGLAGATPVQNVGAYGQDVAQTIASVRVYDRHRQEVRTFANADCGFTYRHSQFKGTARFVVLDVLFQLELTEQSQPIAYADLARQLGVEQGDRVALADARDGVIAQRRKRGMVLDADDHDTWSCGSFFTNPMLSPADFEVFRRRVTDRLGEGVAPPEFPGDRGSLKTSAAWLIDKAGFGKGHGMPGPAALSTKHTLAVTNRGAATASDIAALAREVRDGVEAAFGVRLVNEPVFVGHSL
ncbi:UDP-N-acetylmuramate dehydrogenase [Luteipulveratus halotolerans]|uniref:UDP-N-acetylenolpyruvoylglucosamine reductase n=1 Tax=Luteipulveratus halotolerans TaxID=1631356 RepID=A0A0L6CFM9_9MICO|nr:UDP-N-acetylmuramate dehydrogenase [Luteipulveratus halotolerans]KNX36343.1 UDP-N-acetylenolpyruvoylglucosamine reductase [Luteipulveratus halotolerans]